MSRIVIASASEASRNQLARLLASSGYAVFRLCASEGELRRTLTECEDGIVLVSGIQPDDVVADFGDSFQFLLIGRPGAVEMLTQLHYMRLPRREGRDKALVEDAKRLLMDKYRIDEPEAHRRMQQYAMRHNMKMTDYAAQLLQGGSNDG